MKHCCQYAFFKAITTDMDQILKQNIIDECLSNTDIFDINYNQSELLMHSTLGCDYPIVKLLLENGINVTAQDNQAIINACTESLNIEMIKLLIEYGADVTAQNNKAIVTACECAASIDIMKLLITHGADPLANDNEVICSARYIDTVKFLMDFGADPFAQDNKLFRRMCSMGILPLVEFMIQIGVNCAEFDDGPIADAFYNDRSKLKKILLENGANPNAYTIHIHKPRRYLLHQAVRECNLGDCKLLLKYGADINLCRTEIYNFCRSISDGEKGIFKEIIDLLGDNGLDVNY